MFKSVIEDIYLDNESISEKIAPSVEFKKADEKAYGLYEKLIGMLNGEQKDIFENFADAEVGVRAEAELTHFKAGFKTGLLLAIESLYDF